MAEKQKVAVSQIGTVSYPALVEPNQWGKRAVTLIFAPGTDTSELETLIEAAADLKWPPTKKDGKLVRKRPANFHHPLRDNAEQDGSEGYVEGGTFAKFATRDRVKTFDRDGNGPLFAEDIYPGMQGRVSYAAKWYSKDGGNGVRLQLVNFQKIQDGEPIGGGIRSEGDEFDPLDDADVAEALGS